MDKRLDEWVPANRINTTATPDLARVGSGNSGGGAADSDLKMTRRLKRQYAEIHHVGPGVEELPPIDQHLEKEHQEKTKVGRFLGLVGSRVWLFLSLFFGTPDF